MTEATPEKIGFRFISSLSWDGVAIISSIIFCSVWFGSLSRQVQFHEDQIKHLTRIYEEIAAAQRVQAATIQNITTLVNERTTRKP
jgi:hypothetical protein